MKTAIKQENDEFLVISFQHVSGRKVTVNRPRTTKLWALAHENGHKTRERRVSGHISQTCQGSFETCKSGCRGNDHGRCCNGQRVVERRARAASHLRCE